MKSKIKYVVKTSVLVIMYSSLIINIAIFCFAKTPQFYKTKSIIYTDANGAIVGETLWSKTGTYVDLDSVSNIFVDSLVACEDKRFYKHNGIDLLRIIKSLFSNMVAGEITQGASTITQQFVKNSFYSNEKTYSRKIREIITALKIESRYSKEEILTGYINSLYFGHGIYGIENAAQYYFGKKALELGIAESAMLIGIINAPAVYSPKENYEKAKEKQEQILEVMYNRQVISKTQLDNALIESLDFKFDSIQLSSSTQYYLDSVNSELDYLNLLTDTNINTGLIVETYFDSYINNVVENEISKLSITDQNTNLALLIMEPYSNHVICSIGGKEYEDSTYNRATTAKRQVGSTIKPLIYYQGLLHGLTPITKLKSEPTNFYIRGFGQYSPSNYNDQYAYKDITMIEAVAYSDNIYATKVGLLIGSKTLQNFLGQFNVEVESLPSMFLGTCELTLKELVGIYNTFASEGDYYRPSYIKRVTDSYGRVLYNNTNKYKNLLSYDTTIITNQLLRAPFDTNISGYTSPSLKNYQTEQVFAAKTGTVSNTSWVVGYNPSYTIGIWVGTDDGEPFYQGVLAKYLFKNVANKVTEGLDQRWYSPTTRISVKTINPMTGKEYSKGSVYYLAK